MVQCTEAIWVVPLPDSTDMLAEFLRAGAERCWHRRSRPRSPSGSSNTGTALMPRGPSGRPQRPSPSAEGWQAARLRRGGAAHGRLSLSTFGTDDAGRILTLGSAAPAR